MNPAISFGGAVTLCFVWFVALLALGFISGTPSLQPAFHISLLVSPFLLSALRQFVSIKHSAASPLRKALQISVAGLLAPTLAASLVYMVWVVLLGHGE